MNIKDEAYRRMTDARDHTVDTTIQYDAFIAGAEWARKEALAEGWDHGYVEARSEIQRNRWTPPSSNPYREAEND